MPFGGCIIGLGPHSDSKCYFRCSSSRTGQCTLMSSWVVNSFVLSQGVGNLVDVDLCLSVNNRVPICDSLNGCGLGACLPGFVLDPTTNGCVVAPPVGPSQLRRRTTVARRTLCPSPNETACSLSGRGKLSNSAVVSGQYECVDLSSSIDSCGVCGNVW